MSICREAYPGTNLSVGGTGFVDGEVDVRVFCQADSEGKTSYTSTDNCDVEGLWFHSGQEYRASGPQNEEDKV